jgi:hypothetical protein
VTALYPSTPVVGEQERNKYFSSMRDVVLNAHDSVLSMVKQTCSFPETYQKKYYYSFNPVRTLADDQLIYSFEISHEIEIYHISDLAQTTASLENYSFKDREPFDENKLMDYSYIGNYLHQADRYFALLYDSFHKKFIRIQQIGSDEKLNADGSVNTDNEYNVLVYKKDLTLEKVIRFPAEEKYDFRKVLIVQDGILIKKTVPESMKLKVLKYDLYKLY